jgi:hypothetical protein
MTKKKNGKMDLDKLARMVQKGFEDTNNLTSRGFSELADRMDGMDNRLSAVEQNIIFLRTDMKDLKHDTYIEVEDLRERVARLEKRTGIRK